jgi:lipopolysaccharide transport system ATP-binding protein
MYQVEALCAKAMWIEHGALRMFGSSAEVTSAYQASLNASTVATAVHASPVPDALPAPVATGRIVKVEASSDGVTGNQLNLRSGESDLRIAIHFSIDPTLPPPGVALGISDVNGLTIASASTLNDGLALAHDSRGAGQATIVFQRLPLLKGQYYITCFLITEDGVHIYEQVERCVVVNMTQRSFEQGVVTLEHEWEH